MIELVIGPACITCGKCVDVCPTRVFDLDADGYPVIARQSDCQTCFMCEAYCPTDALYVDPQRQPVDRSELLLEHVGRYRDALGWGDGRTPGSLRAVGPPIPHDNLPPRLTPGAGA